MCRTWPPTATAPGGGCAREVQPPWLRLRWSWGGRATRCAQAEGEARAAAGRAALLELAAAEAATAATQVAGAAAADRAFASAFAPAGWDDDVAAGAGALAQVLGKEGTAPPAPMQAAGGGGCGATDTGTDAGAAAAAVPLSLEWLRTTTKEKAAEWVKDGDGREGGRMPRGRLGQGRANPPLWPDLPAADVPWAPRACLAF